MIYTLLAVIAALVHALFVIFVLSGGLLATRWPAALWVHLPVAIYGVLIMIAGWTCPLTTLEIWLREKAGEEVVWKEFLQHYFFRHLGLSGSEWFIVVVLVIVLVVVNYHPYRAVIGGGLRG